MDDQNENQTPTGVKRLLAGLVRADHLYWSWVFKNAPVLVRTWFEWLNWVLILAGLHLVAEKYHSRVAEVVLYISYLLILYYFQSLYIKRFPEPAEHHVSHVKMHNMVSWSIAFLGAFSVVTFARSVVAAILKATPK